MVVQFLRTIAEKEFWRGVHSILISRPYFFALPNTIDGTFLSIFSPFNFSRLFFSSNKQSLWDMVF